MMRTIRIGSSLLIQGQVVRSLPDGRLVIRLDGKLFTGEPVPIVRAA